MEGPEVFLDSDGMSFEEKDLFWKLIYKNVSKAVKKKHSFTLIFHLDEMGLDNEDGYSIVIQKRDYGTFLRNYLMWSEDLERYETCMEVKTLIDEYKLWEQNLD
jgi:hypothetical protein